MTPTVIGEYLGTGARRSLNLTKVAPLQFSLELPMWIVLIFSHQRAKPVILHPLHTYNSTTYKRFANYLFRHI